jgi:hypothetical protein
MLPRAFASFGMTASTSSERDARIGLLASAGTRGDFGFVIAGLFPRFAIVS